MLNYSKKIGKTVIFFIFEFVPSHWSIYFWDVDLKRCFIVKMSFESSTIKNRQMLKILAVYIFRVKEKCFWNIPDPLSLYFWECKFPVKKFIIFHPKARANCIKVLYLRSDQSSTARLIYTFQNVRDWIIEGNGAVHLWWLMESTANMDKKDMEHINRFKLTILEFSSTKLQSFYS